MINDIENDQGGHVYIEFNKSPADTDSLRNPEIYSIERLDGDIATGEWVNITSGSAYNSDYYIYEA